MDIQKTKMTDEQRLGLPEEPECCNARQPSVDSIREIFRRRAWGAAWREKALELEKKRDELSQFLRELEKERDELRAKVLTLEAAWSTESSKYAAAMADAAMANKERDELRAQLKLAVDAVNRFITAKIDKGEMK